MKTFWTQYALPLTLSAMACAAVYAASTQTLTLNGKVASTRVEMLHGMAYVPVADVAAALGQQVVKRPGGYEITSASGANQVAGLSGKIGSLILAKKYSFQVLSIQKTDHYVSRFLKSPQTYDPDGPNDTLVVIDCRLKNALPKAQGPVLGAGYAGNTALADDQGQSYPPKDYDSRIRQDFSGASLLPGAKTDFAVIFDVPKSANVKDLVFSVNDYFDPNFKGTDVRVSLTP